MRRYIIRRLLWLIVVLLAVSLITFTLMHLVPGGPWDRDKTLAPEVIENLNQRYGLDKPVHEQYLSFLANAIRGDLGVSYIYQDRGVTQILMGGLHVTAVLAIAAFLIAVGIGVPLGIAAALRQNSWIDYVCVFFATVFASIPNFVLGVSLIIFFSVFLHVLPTHGWGTLDRVIMPAFALGAYPAALIARVTRASVLEVLRQDYVRTAHAKGLGRAAVLYRHVLRNAMIPVLTISGPQLAYLVSGSFIIEYLFAVPGIGRLFMQGVFQRDYALIMGVTLFYAFVITILNLIVDILYTVIDPRVRYE